MSNSATASIGNGQIAAAPKRKLAKAASRLQETAPNVVQVPHRIVNSYLVSDPVSGAWVVVDAGMPTSAKKIIRMAEARFGRGARPAAIILTHGHFDHVGSIHPLLKKWDVPVYAHHLEMPYLTGRSDYPPPDPTVGGGAMAWMCRLLPNRGIDISESVQLLPADGSVPHLPQWRWMHTPGHSPGHVSLLRDSDRTLIAGDAFVTVKQESLFAILMQLQEVHGPPSYFTIDWDAARKSVQRLNEWGPSVAATGHGVPMSGLHLTEQLMALAADFDERVVPERGRYVGHPAITDDAGVLSVPPPVPRRWPRVAGVGLALVALGAGVHLLRKHRRMH